MNEPQTDRLRQHPEPRFAASQHQFDLEQVASRLQQEPEAGESGRRQETLYKRGPITVSLFVFGHLTRLAPHRTKGVVTIQVLKGRLEVTAEGESHDLRGGSLLILAPGVQHDVVAREESRMLLTVNLDAAAGAARA
jgi:quercetin dioxygenase-like cupin family protein